jgi:hypothetical protein
MQSLSIFANELAKHFVSITNKKEAAIQIAYEINTHKNAHFKSLNDEEKKLVLNLVEEFISGKSQFILKKDEMIARRKQDYNEFLELKKFILKNTHLI